MHPEIAVDAFLSSRPDLHQRHILLAVSGGQDSVALAGAAVRVGPRFGLRLSLAHVDHALRANSAADAAFACDLAARLGVEAHVERRDVPAFARQHHLSLEAAARAVRYAALAEIAERVGAVAVATGHTADDQAETVLLRLVRGAGPTGLAGMRPDRTLPVQPGRAPMRVLRPLLETTRAETQAYCAERGLPYREDPTNADLRFTRNRVRHEVMPLLARLNPAVREALRRLSRAAVDVSDMVATEAERAWQRLAIHAPGGIGFAAAELRALPQPVQVALLERAYADLAAAEGSGLSMAHLDAALDLLTGGGRQRSVHWSGRLRVQRAGPDLWIGSRPGPPALRPEGYDLDVPGEIVLPAGIRIVARIRDVPCAEALLIGQHVDLRRAVVGDRLHVRGPQPGDRLRPYGLGGSKKVQDILTDAKVPRPDRAAVPVVAGPAGPLWAVGYAAHEPALATTAMTNPAPTERRVDEQHGDRAVVCLRLVIGER